MTSGASASQLGTGSGLVPSNISSKRYNDDNISPSPSLSYCSSANPDVGGVNSISVTSAGATPSQGSFNLLPAASSTPDNVPKQPSATLPLGEAGQPIGSSSNLAMGPEDSQLNSRQISSGRHHPQPVGAAAPTSRPHATSFQPSNAGPSEQPQHRNVERHAGQDYASDVRPDTRDLNESRRDDRRYEPAGFDDHTGGHFDNRTSNSSRGPDPR